MKRILFFALTALLVFATNSCKKEDILVNQVKLDGVKYNIVDSELDLNKRKSGGHYCVKLYLNQDKKTYIYLHVGEKLEDSDIKLTEKRINSENYMWRVNAILDDSYVFASTSNPDDSPSLFSSGTLYLHELSNEAGTSYSLNILLKNGSIKDNKTLGDGKEHTIQIGFSGKVKATVFE